MCAYHLPVAPDMSSIAPVHALPAHPAHWCSLDGHASAIIGAMGERRPARYATCAVVVEHTRGKSHATVRYWPGMGAAQRRRRGEESAN